MPEFDGVDIVCAHGTAMDVHCCNCHGGFLFDSANCVCRFDSPKSEPLVVTCDHCDGTGVRRAAHRSEELKLLADHSEALKFVREMSMQPCPHWCAKDCLACRSKAWLHEATV